MTNFDQSQHPRNSAGTSKGGQFAEKEYSAPEVGLVSSRLAVTDALLERRKALQEAGYVPASTAKIAEPVSVTGDPGKWWGAHWVNAEQRADGTGYAQMPDDMTEVRSEGRSIENHRRGNRRQYHGPEVSLRMPSVSSLRRFADANGNATFDVPFDAEYPGGNIAGFVRVTRNGPYEWSVSGVNINDPKANAYVSEAISAVLESRRPTLAMKHEAADLMARRAERFSAGGVVMRKIDHSSWINAAGYNPHDGTMSIQLGKKVYTYKTTQDVYDQIRTAPSPGKIYNELVKKRSHVMTTGFCDKCDRYYNAEHKHRCASKHHAPSSDPKPFNRLVLNLFGLNK